MLRVRVSMLTEAGVKLSARSHLPFVQVISSCSLRHVYSRAKELAQSYAFFEILYRVTEGARPVANPARQADTSAPVTVPKPIDGAEPVLDALASFRAATSVEEALAAAAS